VFDCAPLEMNVRTLYELAALCRAELVGDGDHRVARAARIDAAGPDEISFLTQTRYRHHLATTRAGAVIVGRGVGPGRPDQNLLVCDDPEAGFDTVVRLFAPPLPRLPVGVHVSAVVDPNADVASDASIGPFCCVGPEAVIGSGAILHAHVTVGAGARIGPRTELHPGVVIYPHSIVGGDCVLHSGAVVGSDGFGFRPSSSGWVKTPQVGYVEIGDRVEIGANSAIDCGRFGPTRIGAGTKIDNLVHVGHNVEIGEDCLLIAQSGIAGSSRLGQRVILAGQAGVAGHLEIGAGARIAGGSGVITDIPAGSDCFGYPAKPRLQALRITKELDRLHEVRKRVEALERRLDIVAPTRASDVVEPARASDHGASEGGTR